MSIAFALSPDERRVLGDLARLSIVRRFKGETDLPPFTPPDGVLRSSLGCFVTLTRDGQLRGCIGSIVGQEPLWRGVARMAQAAAFEDPRFPPLQAREWPHTAMEISVLGPLSPCPDTRQIIIGRHGLLLHYGGRSGVFLPKVPVEQGWDTDEYLENLCRKAGLPPGTWQKPEAQLYWYEALAFPVAMSA